MGIIDEMKLEYRSGGITQQLIFWNVGLFVFPMILFSVLALFNVNVLFLRWDITGVADWLSLSSQPADLLWKPWSLITYGFLHANFLHLFFNMMVLYFSGRLFMTFFTQKQLFGLYILSAIFAGLVFIAGYNLIPMMVDRGNGKMVGASAAIMAILIATATYAPYYQIRLLLVGTVKLWHVAAVLVVLDLIQVSAENQGGHLAHLAGALFGFGYIKLLQNGTDVTKGVTAVTGFFADLFKPRKSKPFKKVHRNANPQSKLFVKKEKDLTQQQIDDILDKISKSGYDSLTKAEKDFLFKAGK